jgi:hypothetical protein
VDAPRKGVFLIYQLVADFDFRMFFRFGFNFDLLELDFDVFGRVVFDEFSVT